jgi:hypothetical protein
LQVRNSGFLCSTTEVRIAINSKHMDRDVFMAFFRDDERLQTLTADDRIEIFSQILIGDSDFSKEFIESVLSDYSVWALRVEKVEN